MTIIVQNYSSTPIFNNMSSRLIIHQLLCLSKLIKQTLILIDFTSIKLMEPKYVYAEFILGTFNFVGGGGVKVKQSVSDES